MMIHGAAFSVDGVRSTQSLGSRARATFGGEVGMSTALTSLTTDAGGSTHINTANVNTTGTQTYGDAVVIGATTNLTGSTVNASAQGSSALGADQNGFVSATNSTVASTGASALYLITGVNVAGGVGPTIALTDTKVTTTIIMAVRPSTRKPTSIFRPPTTIHS